MNFVLLPLAAPVSPSQFLYSPEISTTPSVHRDHIKKKLEFATSAEMIRMEVRRVETQGKT